MLTRILEWVSLGTFFVMITTILYNRILSFRKIEAQTIKLENQFETYQRTFAHYLQVCELCRAEVRRHHEDEPEKHVSPSMAKQIDQIVADISEIKMYLMTHPIPVVGNQGKLVG